MRLTPGQRCVRKADSTSCLRHARSPCGSGNRGSTCTLRGKQETDSCTGARPLRLATWLQRLHALFSADYASAACHTSCGVKFKSEDQEMNRTAQQAYLLKKPSWKTPTKPFTEILCSCGVTGLPFLDCHRISKTSATPGLKTLPRKSTQVSAPVAAAPSVQSVQPCGCHPRRRLRATGSGSSPQSSLAAYEEPPCGFPSLLLQGLPGRTLCPFHPQWWGRLGGREGPW